MTQRLAKRLLTLGAREWPSDDLRFWQFDLDLDPTQVDRALREIRAASAHDVEKEPKALVILLMHVLRSSLPGVRANRLWPDVAELFYGPSEKARSQRERCPRLFRDCLQSVFGDRLRHDLAHHRYVRLLLDETGVGHDRAAIIHSFLLGLLEVPTPAGMTRAEMKASAELAVEDHLRREARPDVEALQPVLLRAGNALLRIRHSLLIDADPNEVAEWTWRDLEAFARNIAGEDLNQVIPEARSVFEALMPSLCSQLSCINALRMSQSGGAIAFPPSFDMASRPARIEEVPLGAARLGDGNSRRRVDLLDPEGFSAAAAVALGPDRWCTLSQGRVVAILRPIRFAVVRQGSPRAECRCVYDVQDRPAGYFWSGRTFPGDGIAAVPKDSRDAPTITLSRAPSFVPVSLWTWNQRGYALRLTGLAYYDNPRSANVVVSLGGETLFRGPIEAGRGLLGTRGATIPLTADEALGGVELGVEIAGLPRRAVVVRLPMEPYAVIDEDVQALERAVMRLASRGGHAPFIVVGPRDWGPPRSEGAAVRRWPSIEVRPGMEAFELSPGARSRVTPFDWGSQRWGAFEQSSGLVPDFPKQVFCDGVEIRATGSLWPAKCGAGPLPVRLTRGDSQGPMALVLDGGVVRWRYDLDPAQSEFDLAPVLESMPSDRVDPLIGIRLETRAHRENASFAVFRVPPEIRQESAGLNERPRLELRYGPEFSVVLDALDVASAPGASVAAVMTFPAHPDLEPGSGITFIWTPERHWIVLASDTGPVASGQSLDLAALDSLKIDTGGHDDQWSLLLQDISDHENRPMGPLAMPPRGTASLREWLLNHLSSLTVPARRASLIAVYRDREVARWPVVLAPMLSTEATLQDSGAVVEISVRIEGLILETAPVDVGIKYAGQSVASMSVRMERETPGSFRAMCQATLSIRVSLLRGYSTKLIVEVTAAQGVTLASEVSLPRVKFAAPDIPTQVRALLEQPCDPAHAPAVCRAVAVLSYDFMQANSRLPLDGDVLARKLEVQFRDTEGVGAASLCLKTLKQLCEPSKIPQLRPLETEEATAFGVVVNSIVLEVLEREAARGTMDRDLLARVTTAVMRQAGALSSFDDVDGALSDRCARLAASGDFVHTVDSRKKR